MYLQRNRFEDTACSDQWTPAKGIGTLFLLKVAFYHFNAKQFYFHVCHPSSKNSKILWKRLPHRIRMAFACWRTFWKRSKVVRTRPRTPASRHLMLTLIGFWTNTRPFSMVCFTAFRPPRYYERFFVPIYSVIFQKWHFRWQNKRAYHRAAKKCRQRGAWWLTQMWRLLCKRTCRPRQLVHNGLQRAAHYCVGNIERLQLLAGQNNVSKRTKAVGSIFWRSHARRCTSGQMLSVLGG